MKNNLSEEEKKAIEELGHYEFRSKTIYNNKINKADVRDSKIILNYIDRLQKENEELEQEVIEYNKRGQTIRNIATQKGSKMYELICKDFIPKDKIKDKIKEFEEIEQKDSVINENGVCCVPAYWLAKLKKEVLEDLIKEK